VTSPTREISRSVIDSGTMHFARTNVQAYARTLAQQHWFWAGCLAGAAFVTIFATENPLPPDAYQYRDDGIITLSHARNLVDFGSIGVDPAGARVEGFSAPLQFWIFAGAYALTHCDYQPFLDWQTWICTFLLGFAVVQLFRRQLLLGLIASAVIAWSLAKAVRFIGWHGSGMENPYTHVLFVACVAAAVLSIESGRISRACVPLFVIASLSRLESIVHVAPLLVVWSVGLYIAHRSWGALRGSAVVLACFGAYQLARWLYFGDLRPNTAIAEGIDVIARLRSFARHDVNQQLSTAEIVRNILSEHRGYLVLFSIPLLVLAPRRTGNVALVGMLACLFASALLHPVLFGAARLDPVRTTSHMALVAPLLIATQWLALPTHSARVLSFVGLSIALGLYGAVEPPSSTFFCCPIGKAERIAERCLQHAQSEGLTRPSLASPDLGKISFRKTFLVFDLGMLGSAPLARLKNDQRAAANYLLDLALPDYIELHGGWACHWGYLQQDPRFAALYSVMPGHSKLHLRSSCRDRSAGVWFRNDMTHDSASPERRLVDDLSQDLNPARVATELRRCRLQEGSNVCAYVSRSVYRFLPELGRGKRAEQMLALFKDSPSADYDRSILSARDHAGWYRSVITFAQKL